MATEDNMRDAIEIEVDDSLKVSGDPTKLYEALATAASQFEAVPKMADGAITKDRGFKYADYATLMRCVRPALSAHGVTVLQPLHSRDGMAITTTIVAGHGASIRCSFSFHQDKNPQEFGRHHTYYRRYQLQGMLGLAGDADADDLPLPNAPRAEQGFSEPAREPASSPKASPAPKATESAAKKPAAATPKTNGSAKPSETSTPKPPVVDSKPAEAVKKVDNRPINDKLVDAMKQLSWTMKDVRAFYLEQIDPSFTAQLNDLQPASKQHLFDKLVEVKGVQPF